ncbi:MAG: metal ABC transporter ATP-binding protein [Pseudomonadota bacterium]
MLQASSPLVVLSGAGIFRSGRWLIRDVDLSLQSNEIVTLIGPNGSGKSTTAKMALGLLKPDEGQAIQRDGLTVGYVPQSVTIDWSMPLSVTRFLSLTSKPRREALDEAMARTGVTHLAKAEVRTLSGGEFQRVLLARAIARKPDLLVLDEPVQGVDYSGEIALYDLISEVRDELRCAVLLISHDLHVVMAATDRVLCLNGHVCCEGSPTNVIESAAYRELFGSRAAGTLAVYRHDHDHVHHADGRVCHSDEACDDPHHGPVPAGGSVGDAG